MKRILVALLALCVMQAVTATQPTLVAQAASTFTESTTTARSAGTFTWLTGDVLHVIGMTEDNSETFSTPTATGLTFSLITDTNSANNTRVYYWRATAGSDSSAAVSATILNNNSGGIQVWQYRGGDGAGTPVTIVGSSAKTISVTRAGTDSHVILGMADWNQVGDVTVTASPSTDGTQRVAEARSGRADFFAFDWANQGATGTTAYGIANHTGTVDMTGIAVEIKGTAGGGGSSPVPAIMQMSSVAPANDPVYAIPALASSLR